MQSAFTNTTMPARSGGFRPSTPLLLATFALMAAGVDAQSIDRNHEKNPNWPAPPTRDTEAEYPSRIGLRRTPLVKTRTNEVSDAPNPRSAAALIDATNRKTTPHDLDVYRKDGQPGIGYSSLLADPREAAADQTGRNLVAQSLTGRFLNGDPRSLDYLRNAARAMNLGAVTRDWEWAFGSEKFIRIAGSGSLLASVGAGTANHAADLRVVGTFFRRTREIGAASLKSNAPASPTAAKTANLTVTVLGRPLVNENISNAKPYLRNLRVFELAPLKEWWAGSLNIPWLGLSMALKLTSDPVTITPRVAVGNASVAGEVSLRSGLETLGDVPLGSVFGFCSIVARINFRPFDGQVIGGNSVGLAWSNAGKPLLRDARFVRTEVEYGAVNLKIKALTGFKIFGFSIFEKDKTLWSVFKHDGRKSSREYLSHIREIPLR